MDKPTVAHTRLNLANERTLLAWIKLGCIIGGGGFLSHVLMPSQRAFHMENSILVARKQATYLGAQLLLAFFVLALGLRLFFRRRSLLSVKWLGSYTASFSPCVAIVGVLVTLLLTLFQALVHEVQYNSPDCMRLKLPLQEAPPPYLYISFHGSPDPLGGLCSGVGAVHRFSLTGAYQGPATDQRAALVHAPRMMVMHNELLVLADAGEGAELHRPALAIFGDCSSRNTRPFLGRVRATDAFTEARFEHPYGLASGKNGVLRVTAQNGGALLEVNLLNSSNPIQVIEQLEPPDSRNIDSLPDFDDAEDSTKWEKENGINAKSGPLRGLAIDDTGCSHVADKSVDKVWHVCPGEKLRSTHVPKPVGVHFHSGRLYVGSFVRGDASVHVLEQNVGGMKDEGEGDAYRMKMKIVHPRLLHPAGLVVQGGTLYVLEQVHRALLTFDVSNGNFTGALLDQLLDAPEGIMYSPGC